MTELEELKQFLARVNWGEVENQLISEMCADGNSNGIHHPEDVNLLKFIQSQQKKPAGFGSFEL